MGDVAGNKSKGSEEENINVKVLHRVGNKKVQRTLKCFF